MLDLNETYRFVEASVAGADNAEMVRSQDGFRILFLVTLSAAGTVWVEAAAEPVHPGLIRWVPISGTVTTTDSIAVSGNFQNLRVIWTANTGTVSVDLVQSALSPKAY